MPLVEWSDRLSVGVARFDAEHRKLTAVANDLFDAVQAGKGKEALGDVLDELLAYTQAHFSHEEEAMRAYGYPEADAHIEEHKALARRMQEFRRKYMSGSSAVLAMEVMNFVKNSLLRHIWETDKRYAGFMHANGVR